MRSIVRKDTGQDWKEYVKGLMAEEGVENPSDEEVRRFDKKAASRIIILVIGSGPCGLAALERLH